ncbi:MAG: hypothetical protein IPJ17_14560 [Holophagales bacterium]|nr:MAG: hypothetical protein IPJ17_14560 [Holophagales bacterium]
MRGILIVTHGHLAPELLETAKTILGRELQNVRALSLEWTEGWDEARTKIAAEIAAFAPGTEGVLVLTDLHGDTPSRAAASFQEPGRVEVVTGVNLPMVVRLGCAEPEQRSLTELAHWIEVKGRRAIRRADPPAAESHPRTVDGDSES